MYLNTSVLVSLEDSTIIFLISSRMEGGNAMRNRNDSITVRIHKLLKNEIGVPVR